MHAEEVEDQIPLERHGGHLQAEETEYKVQLITEYMVLSELSTAHLHAEEGEDQVQLNPEQQGDHIYAFEGPTQYRKAWLSPAEGRARGRRSGSTQH